LSRGRGGHAASSVGLGSVRRWLPTPGALGQGAILAGLVGRPCGPLRAHLRRALAAASTGPVGTVGTMTTRASAPWPCARARSSSPTSTCGTECCRESKATITDGAVLSLTARTVRTLGRANHAPYDVALAPSMTGPSTKSCRTHIHGCVIHGR